ncbi:kell blood group glycoprotein-like isoform X1 [Ambystoma mexicanum]|uniref:kell blood group glycoprotein-like isoform X1 n=1 Tax=Ambystoma mexicanum TaxID=8296 RepID=UPI0037E88EC1
MGGKKGHLPWAPTLEAFLEDRKVPAASTRSKKWTRRVLSLCILFFAALILLLILIFTILSCGKGFRPCETRACRTLTDNLLSSRDPSIDPCEDFFGHVCGNWGSNDTLYLETGSVNTFDLLWEENQLMLKALLERKENGNQSSAEAKAQRFYRSCMNTEKIEELGAWPMVELLKKVAGWSAAGVWQRGDFNQTLRLLMGEYSTFPFFRAYAHPSPLFPDVSVIQIDHPHFDMPARSHFEKERDYLQALRVYYSYLQNLTDFLGEATNTAAIPTVFSLTSKLLNEVTPLTERRERGMLFRSTTIGELQGLAPAIDWLSCLQAAFYPRQLNSSELIFVHDMDYMVGMSKLVELWRKSSYLHIYMALCLVQNLSPALDQRFQKVRRELSISTQESESQAMEVVPRWKKCMSDTDRFFESVLGAMFVRKTFSTETKKLAEDIFAEVRAALDRRLEHIEWMDKETRMSAKMKLDSIKVKIGYPAWIMDKESLDREYGELDLGEDTFFDNVVTMNDPRRSFHLGSLDPHGQDIWQVVPSAVHSYYSISQNAVVFPAGMFRSPFFHLDFPSAVNFGAIGVFMAHELLHAFYDYVPHTTVRGDQNGLHERLLCLEKKYNSYTLQNLTANGTTTQLENMADCGGLLIAHQAYESWLKKQKQETVLPMLGLSHHQLFYASFAQTMCGRQTTENLRSFLKKDRHSPNPVRVAGAISNDDNFPGYFQCPTGSPMNPLQKCQVW